MLVVGVACDDDDNGDATPTATVGQPRTPTPGVPPLPTSTLAPGETPGAAAISIAEPAEGANVRSPVTARGDANVFEAALIVQLLGNAAGGVLCERFVMATSGSGTPGTWETTLAGVPPESASPATIRAFTRRALENQVDRAITLSSELPNIVIESPTCAAEVQAESVLAVRGTAVVFEATLSVDLRDQTGAVIETKNLTASAGGPDRGTWDTSFDLTGLDAGSYEIVAYSISPANGEVENEFAIPIRITT
jgi:hypothetical protein